jgi:hypothetical protein
MGADAATVKKISEPVPSRLRLSPGAAGTLCPIGFLAFIEVDTAL